MKKIYFLFLTILLTTASYGQVILAEDFSYPDGSLVSNSAWTNNGGTAGDFVVASGQAIVEHGMPSEDVKISFNAVTGDLFFALDFSVDDLGAPFSGTDSEYFAHLGFDARVDIVEPSAGGDFTVGIATSAGTADATWATDLTYGQTYRVVVGYNLDTATPTLWINPTTAADTSISGNADGGPVTITSFDLRQSDSSENETVRVDNLMIGQSFDDVVVFAAPTNPSVSIISPSNASVFDPGTTNVDVVFTTANTTDEIVNITVNGTTTQNVTSPFSITTVDGGMYDVTVDLVNQGGTIDTQMTSFSVNALTVVADIAALRADVDANGTDGVYQLQSVPTVTYTRTSRNQKYIQDASAGILIDDVPGNIATTFAIGDGMSGLTGGVSFFNGVLQFNPNADAAVAPSTPVTPEVVTIATLLTNFADYQSELVQINDVTFTETGTFAASTNYTINDASNVMPSSMVFRTSFAEANYIGQPIPTTEGDIVVLVAEFGGAPQVTARDLNDLTLSTETFEQEANFSIYPNPTNTGSVTIKTNTNGEATVAVFDILGKQVITQTLTNNTLNVSNLKTGVYLVKISQNGATTTKKLVIE